MIGFFFKYALRTIVILVLLMSSAITKAQIITTFAGGGGTFGLTDVPATVVNIANARGGAFDKYGNYYFCEGASGHRVRKIDPSGIITTIAGTGVGGFSGDGSHATTAQLNAPTDVFVDNADNIYISDGQNFRIRKIDAVSGTISTVAGNGTGTYSGDGGAATDASIANPPGIFVDKYGNLFIADFGNARVRKVNTSGIISSFAGNGDIAGYSGDGSKADTSRIGGISDVFVDNSGNVYLASSGLSRVFKVDGAGIISTIAGNASGYLYNGDEIPATASNIDVGRITGDKYGNLYIAEHLNYRVRQVDKFGIIHTLAGIGTSGFSGDGGLAKNAQLSYPSGVALDSCENLYIAEANNNRIRKVTFPNCHYLNVKETKQDAEEGINIYPIPANNELTITAPEEIKSVSVVDMVGQSFDMLTMTARKNEMVLNIRHLPAGVYVVRVNGVYFRKFVKE